MKKVVIGVIIAICCVCIGGGVAYATAKGSSNSTLPQGVALSNQQETPAEQTLQKNNPNSLTPGEIAMYDTQSQFTYDETMLYNAIQAATNKVSNVGDFITTNLSQYFDYNGIRYYKVYDYFENWTGQLADSNGNYSGLRGVFYVSTTGKMLTTIPQGVKLQVSNNLTDSQKQNELLKNAAEYIVGNAPLEPNNAYVNFNLSADLSKTKVIDGHTCYLITIKPKVNEQDGTITGATQNYNTTNIPKVPGTNYEKIYVSLSGYVYIPTHK